MQQRSELYGFGRRWWNSEWWSKYLHPTEEWRVHVFDGRSIARGIKIHSGNSWRKARVRNIGNGWSFDFTRDSPRGLRTVAKAAVQALGYPVGAVDILQVDRIDPTAPEGLQREFYVLEVNRIPALTCSYTRTAWVEAIRRHVREDSQPNENIE
jgi:glutathione synthase/RimK-type ligase-like ATP-grasp enzyme